MTIPAEDGQELSPAPSSERPTGTGPTVSLATDPVTAAEPPALERFEMRGRLGSGGMGVVYRALDRQRGIEVALKTMRHASGRDLYRFKREFRALADLVHPNLVTLYELHTVGGDWFLTMELVDGVSFIDWLRPRSAAPPDLPPGDDSAPTDKDVAPRGENDAARQRLVDAPLQIERLEAALYQLVDIVHAVHQAGKLHRDLKPSNVLVDTHGRVVLLDFGLVTEVDRPPGENTHDTGAVGTPAYMSPEQAEDKPLTPASDWYSVGVMLYEALTGRRPLDVYGPRPGDPASLPRPRLLDARVPESIERLCLQLLQFEPSARPDGAAVLAALGKAPSPASQELVQILAFTPFVDREAELAALHEALAVTRASRCMAVLVRGPSGMGKTALLRQFLGEAKADPATIVLLGRCYEREAVAFKTLDTLIDSLTAQLANLDGARVEALLPPGIRALARLFPVLRRIPAIFDSTVAARQPQDPSELRRRAFGALRELLGRLAASAPVILAIDDVQWGDADSGAVLADLIFHPDAPPILIVACLRREDEAQSQLISVLRLAQSSAGAAGGERIHELSLGPLDEAAARGLVVAIRGDSGGEVQRLAIVREAGGSPFFLSELARMAPGELGGAESIAIGLDALVQRRLAQLPAEARLLAVVCAVAGRPLPVSLALRAVGLREGTALPAQMCAERLLRVRRSGAAEAELETYHDRIRASILARLSPAQQRDIHAGLARMLEQASEPDDEALVAQWLGANDLARAASHAAVAAARAEERLAFHRAADLYSLALAHGRHADDEGQALRTRLGHALAHAGRLDEAASAFAAAAEHAPPARRLELHRLELEQLLRGGRVAEGLIKGRAVLESIGFHVPRSRASALATMFAHRLDIRLRDLVFEPRAPEDIDHEALRRIDALYSVAAGLAFVQPILGMVLQTRHVREALAGGEPHHAGIALSVEACYLAMRGAKAFAQAQLLAERAIEIGRQADDAEVIGMARGAAGLVAFLSGRWRTARDHLGEAERVLRDECLHARWQLDMTELFVAAADWYLGETKEMAHLVPVYVREAEERGDLYALHGLRSGRCNAAWLVLGRPEEARAHIRASSTPRDPVGAQLVHHYSLLAHSQIELYTGDAWGAHTRVEGTWQSLARAMLLRIESVFVEAWYLRARAALAAASTGAGEQATLRRLALLGARRINERETGYGAPLAHLVRATVAHQAGDAEAAVSELQAAEAGFVAADMALYLAATRCRLGQLLGGSTGGELVKQGDAFMRQQAVVDPAAMTNLLAPGW